MSRWNHSICRRCYAIQGPDREPVRVINMGEISPRCCFCGGPGEWIFYRYDPDKAPCSGHGGTHERDEP